MKKLVRILSLTLVVVMMCAALASCASPAKDPKDAAAALKENGYTVTVEGEKMVSALKDDEFIVINYCDDKDEAKEMYEEAKDELADAEEELAEAREELEKAKEELEKVKDNAIQKGIAEGAVAAAEKIVEMAEKYVGCEVGQSGTVVWLGTKQAIKDAK